MFRCKEKKICAFIDLEKAYDKVDRNKLWDVMAEYGIEGGLLNVRHCMMDVLQKLE